ncbi:MAG: cell division protein FtsZ [Flavobacteriaceae bacterium]|jgi:cell division protein FtsZ|nr:cell division protein FtsZ [Flavobacteriaceae bacterium]
MENTFSFDMPKGTSSIIKVIGVGGGGNNALKYMYEKGIHGVDFVICNTDAQALDNNPVSNKIQLGITITEGLGAGADPEVGEKAAIESIEEIKSVLGQNTKMVFITAGMGGGTGTGAAPVIAKTAKDMGILTIAIVTVPFSFEGKRRLDQAESGLEKLRGNVDSLIVINNDKLRQQFGNLGYKQGFAKADEVLTNAAKGMAEVITGYFDINVDFRDAKSVLENSGTALMSTGTASGENRAEEAVKNALDSPLLNDNKITGAKKVLVLIRSGNKDEKEATMDEIGLINDHIQREAGNTADIIPGIGADEELGDAVSVMVIATGFSKDNQKHSGPAEKIKINLHDTLDEKPTHFKPESPLSPEGENNNEYETIAENKTSESTKTRENTFSFVSKKTNNGTQNIGDFNNETNILYSEEMDIEENDEQSFDLFSYEDEEEKSNVEAESFSFETEKTEPEHSATGGKGIDFFINEPINEPADEIFADEISENVVVEANTNEISEKPEDPRPIEFLFDEPENETIAENTEIAEEQSPEFTFINKNSDSEKVAERRNKLKEFNSRYFVVDEESEFESVPAFKRKNIAIEKQNASEQQINSFLSETETGQVQLRENRFLNKDVD